MLVGLLQVHEGQVGPVDPDPAPPPLPGGAAEVVRFFMEVPQWLQIGGAVVGGIAAVVGAVLLWNRRKEFGDWVAGLPAAVKATALAVLVAGGTLASVGGYQVYDFVEHDNRFCTGCHLMADPYISFEESAHVGLGCKDCHAQPRTESMRQLYLWVLDRPQEVGPHSPVPDARCTSCHVEEDPDRWPQIAASLGHAVHFESDDPELADLMCVTCHGVGVHDFAAADVTCAACHEAEASIQLGGMAEVTDLHCAACHDFMGDQPVELPGVPEGLALLPDRGQCQACHDMAGLLNDAELDVDPHGAVCGACHNPHTQDAPGAAVETCLGCHEGADTITVFHTGTHAPVLPNCTACHSAHGWTVQGSECLDCHDISILDGPRADAGWEWELPNHSWQLSPASRATSVRGSAVDSQRRMDNGSSNGHWAHLARHVSPPEGGGRQSGGRDSDLAPAPADTTNGQDPRPFLHRQHEVLSCLECHGTAEGHGILSVRTVRDCAACHHDPQRPYECGDCHADEDLAPTRRVTSTMNLTVWDETRTRELPFEHHAHETLECQECHTGPVMLAVEKECAACHEDHHRAEADCATCHLPAPDGVHGLEVHLTCTSSGCHAGTAGERPEVTRSLCLTCHVDQRDHEVGLSCQGCHMVPIDPPLRRSVGSTSMPIHGAGP